MNKFRYTMASLLMMLCVTFTSCINDLDVEPLNDNIQSANDALSTPEAYSSLLSKIYAVWALPGQDGAGDSDIEGLDPGNTVLLRSWWTLQVNSTDEAKCAWGDTWASSINNMTWTTTQVEPIEGVYQRCMYIVSIANNLIKQLPNAPTGVDKESYNAQARFGRALAYYTLMDMFGRPPFITENNYSLTPTQIERDKLFDWIESELLDIIDKLPAYRTEYGRADQNVVKTLLARMYLNAEVYTGVNRYADCVTMCNDVIASGHYSLAPDYSELFMADNGENTKTQHEIIFPIIFDGAKTQSYGIGAIIFGSRGTDVVAEDYGISGGWAGFRSTSKLVKNFEFNGTMEFANIADTRGIFYDTDRTLEITDANTFSQGWSVHKFTNKKSDGTNGSNLGFPDTDFPMFRLADVYLMYAEAAARGGGGSLATAVGYINKLRQRGYGDNSADITEAWLTATAKVSSDGSSVQYGNILNERSRELYWEGTRRTDLIRFGLFAGNGYLWDWKGGVASGIGTVGRYDIFPIPATDLSVNGELTQNEGY